MIIRLYRKYLAVFLTVALIICSLAAANQRKEQKSYLLPIIMYHHICTKPSSWGAYVVSPETFEKDIRYLSEHGYKTVTTQQLIDFEENGTPLYEKSVMITFDDGYESFYAYAFDILKKYNFTAVLSVIGQEADKYSQINHHNIVYSNCNWTQLKEMHDSALVEIGNHTYNLHKFGERQGCKIKAGEDKSAYAKMLRENIEKLQNRMRSHGIESNIFTYPFGEKCDLAEKVVHSMGFKVAFGYEEKVNVLYGKNPAELQSLKRFNRPNGISTYDFFKKIM